MREAAVEEIEPGSWDGLLGRLGVTDAYYARGYVESAALLVGGSPTLLHLAAPEGDVVFACVVRADPTDVVTPYGYGGPVGTGAAPPLAAWATAYQAWCEARGVLTSFAVFHPLFANASSPAAEGFHRTALGDTVAWPLAGADLLAGMHAKHRNLVRRAEQEGLEATVDPRPADLDAFVALYEDTMRRADAAPFYFFAAAYWRALLDCVPIVRVDVRDGDGELMASALGLGRPPWLHYHLAATADEGRRIGASHLALFALARWGQENGFDTLHLGGGVGGRADSLQRFKRRFAPDGEVPSVIGKAVHDEQAYLRLTGEEQVDWDAFFPAYRSAS